MFEHKDYGKTPIVFPAFLEHIQIGKAIENTKLKPVSAGFCYLDANGEYVCSGQSDSMNLQSQESDGVILTSCLT